MVDPDRIASKAAPTLSGRLSFALPQLFERVLSEPDLTCFTRQDWDALLAENGLDDSAQLARARDAIEWLVSLELSKFSDEKHDETIPNVPYVLVLDQPRTSKEAPAELDMAEMLVFAQTELLNAQVAILTCENGFFSDHNDPRVTLLPPETPLYPLLENATSVYTHSAGPGFDAILAGHRPRVFGRPWYGSLDLTQDENPNPYATRRLTRAQLFCGAFMLSTTWQSGDQELEIEDILSRLEARLRARAEDRSGYVASNILPWKRPFLRRYLGHSRIVFSDKAEDIARHKDEGARHIVWGQNAEADLRLEDGFLRSRGLGAALVRPLSLVLDDSGIYFDPTRPSRLEAVINARADLSAQHRRRAEAFVRRMTQLRLTKYNVGEDLPALPEGYRILVAGQVEDDASIRLGAGDISTNLALLQAARAAHPEAVIVYKPHPDVEAGLRRGKTSEAHQIADVIAERADPIALIDACDEVWTMTSLLGFEALLRGKTVTCTGAPFYAGWGLTTDLGSTPARRAARPDLMGLAHAVLIDYPRYFHPETGAALAPEEALELLALAPNGRSHAAQLALAKLRQLRAALLGLR
ncbi:capsular polysaccharide biosynthesis protein [Celeribacter sp. PS-C1]|uniref:capsular polysaccharide biosynthesis protein n=1 Tax=Celeribacter sp. PS-C1 TaxID=2820813 RepID=UPI001CA59C30|nr:capsular polysaccharide biosynthesis protein [Celeribacter sp. PS-C1]MBW6416745.1 capsular polysaccharide biosynthesis protein [Celeribacter sp. PS-C1]